MDMSSRWVHITPLPIPYPCFEIEKNPNSIKMEKSRQIRVGMTTGAGIVAMPKYGIK